MRALSRPRNTYLLIRDLYDVDNVGFGPAIGLYIRQLAWWSKQHNWPGIISYFVAHFCKHQSSNDPSDWYNVDIQLFTGHGTHDPRHIWQIIRYGEPSLRSVAVHLLQLE